MKRVIALLAAAALLCGAFSLFAAAAPIQAADTEGFAAEILQLVNAEREKAGLAALGSLEPLSAAAQKRAEEIADKFSHTRPGGRDCFTVMDDYGVAATSRGENIAAGQVTPAEAMDSWMNSSGHRKNILGDFHRMGVGVYVKNGTVYWAQLFIREDLSNKPAPAWKSWPPPLQLFARAVLFGWIWMK